MSIIKNYYIIIVYLIKMPVLIQNCIVEIL